jgi:peptidoglycan/LPS O-acetylase OafA/YrhL
VAIGALNQDVIVPVPYLRPALVWVGERSYSLYLSHPLIVYADNWLRVHWPAYLAEPDWARAALNIGLMLLAGELSYRFVELPGERIGGFVRRWLASRPPEQPQPTPAE